MKSCTLQFLQKLQTKWQLNNFWQVIAVLSAFSLAGSTVVVIRPWFFQWLGMDEQASLLLKTLAYIVFIFPMYQVLLLVYGSLLGQHQFFTHKTKKIGLRLSAMVATPKVKD